MSDEKIPCVSCEAVEVDEVVLYHTSYSVAPATAFHDKKKPLEVMVPPPITAGTVPDNSKETPVGAEGTLLVHFAYNVVALVLSQVRALAPDAV